MENVRGPGDDLLDCLVFVSKHHGLTVTAEALKSGLPLAGGRVAPSVFSRAAKRAGLRSRVAVSPLDKLNGLLFPVVLLLDDEKACVLISLDQERNIAAVYVPDDGGLTEVDIDLLKDRYTGYAIYARPEFRFDERTLPDETENRGHWFWSAIAENRGLYRDLLIGALMINLFALAMPLFVMNVYNRVVPNRAVETLWVLASAVLVVVAADFLLRVMRAHFTDAAAVRVNVELSSRLFERFMGLKMKEKPVSTGAFAANVQAFESVRQFISSAVVTSYVDLPFAIVFIAVIGLIAWPLMIPIVAGGAVVILYALVTQGAMRDLSQTSLQAGSMRNSLLVEYLAALDTVKLLGAEGKAQGKWERLVLFLEKTNARLRFYSALLANGALWVQFTVSVVVMIMGVYLIFQGALSMGGLIAVYILSSRAMAPIGRTAGLLVQYHQASRSLASLDDVMQKDVERPGGVTFYTRSSFRGSAAFNSVSFAYPDSDTPALKDFSISVGPGEKIAVLGRVGSGKSTIARLLTGLYEPDEGAVYFDGVDIRQIDPAELRRNIGCMPQETTLFYGSLRDNIAMAADGASEEDVFEAVRLAGFGGFVNSTPRGLDLNVGERGERLSSGQRQAVGLARTFIKKAPFLLLDEPTSFMDSAAEQMTVRGISEFARDRTLVLITHKKNLLGLVDRIAVLDGGKMILDGARDEVLEKLAVSGGGDNA